MKRTDVHAPQLCRIVACVAFLIYSLACTRWHVVGPTPADYLQTHRPSEVRLTRSDSSRISLRTPVLRGDTLVGTGVGGLALGDTARTLGIPLSAVRAMAVHQFSLGKTLGLYLIITLPVYIIACSGGGAKLCLLSEAV